MQSSHLTRYRALLLTTLLSIGMGNVRAETIPLYAPVKERICADCKISVPAAMVPQRGVLLSIGSFLTPLGYWQAVDLDSRKMTRFVTQMDAASHQLSVTQSRSVDLDDTGLTAVVTLANAVWRLPQQPPAAPATDVTWGIDLLDRGVIRREHGAGNLLQGEGADLKTGLDQIWARLAR